MTTPLDRLFRPLLAAVTSATVVVWLIPAISRAQLPPPVNPGAENSGGTYAPPVSPPPASGETSEPDALDPSLPASAGDIKIDLKTDKDSYVKDDLMKVTVGADKDCYLRLYYLSADKSLVQVFPNKYDQENNVKAGTKIQLPPAENAKFRFRLGEPFGKEVLVAVASPKQFQDIHTSQWVGDQVFPQFDDISFRSMLLRGLFVEASTAAATEGEPGTDSESAAESPADDSSGEENAGTAEESETDDEGDSDDPTNIEGENLIAKPSWAKVVYEVAASTN